MVQVELHYMFINIGANNGSEKFSQQPSASVA